MSKEIFMIVLYIIILGLITSLITYKYGFISGLTVLIIFLFLTFMLMYSVKKTIKFFAFM